VFQGDCLSPFLFPIDDLEYYLIRNKLKGIDLGLPKLCFTTLCWWCCYIL